jgi:hypothetical protein
VSSLRDWPNSTWEERFVEPLRLKVQLVRTPQMQLTRKALRTRTERSAFDLFPATRSLTPAKPSGSRNHRTTLDAYRLESLCVTPSWSAIALGSVFYFGIGSVTWLAHTPGLSLNPFQWVSRPKLYETFVGTSHFQFLGQFGSSWMLLTLAIWLVHFCLNSDAKKFSKS